MAQVFVLNCREQQLRLPLVKPSLICLHHCPLHTDQHDETVTWVMAGVLVLHSTEPSYPWPADARHLPAVVSHTGRLLGQQCWWSLQQVASGRGQQAQVKQKPKKSLTQQQVEPAADEREKSEQRRAASPSEA